MSRLLYTYDAPVPELASYYDAGRLLDLWRAAWGRLGWRTVVLTREIAARHPAWSRYEAAVRRLPTVNARAYEDANYHRWLAMAVVGGGLMADADVLPIADWTPATHDKLTVYSVDYLEGDSLCPCFVHGTARQYEETASYFAESATWAGGLRHVSDQELLRARRAAVEVHPQVLTYGDPRIAQAKAVHFKTDAIAGESGTKSERVARLYAGGVRPARRSDRGAGPLRPSASGA